MAREEHVNQTPASPQRRRVPFVILVGGVVEGSVLRPLRRAVSADRVVTAFTHINTPRISAHNLCWGISCPYLCECVLSLRVRVCVLSLREFERTNVHIHINIHINIVNNAFVLPYGPWFGHVFSDAGFFLIHPTNTFTHTHKHQTNNTLALRNTEDTRSK